jgi:hypothetical protein
MKFVSVQIRDDELIEKLDSLPKRTRSAFITEAIKDKFLKEGK